MNTYLELISQSYEFPQEGFSREEGFLTFHGVSLRKLIEKYGAPFKLVYLPSIVEKIVKARNLFGAAIQEHDYKGRYQYAYCTKCCHFSHVIKAALRADVHLETSSSFDVDLIFRLLESGDLTKETILVHNGYKTDDYLEKVIALNRAGFKNSVLVLDSKSELERVKALEPRLNGTLNIGIRIAMDEEPQSAYYTSRLGIRPGEILDFIREKIVGDEKLNLSMVHFFIDSGIKDSPYYWGEFQKALNLFVQMKQECPSIRALNIGGGFPIRNGLGFRYDYDYIVSQIVSKIKVACVEANVAEPDIFTEFGKYTVGESGAIIFQVLEEKVQNDREAWYMVNNSLMNTIPDAWSIFEKFILLPLNKWESEYQKVNIGGISCDHSDYYNSEDFNQQLFLPTFEDAIDDPLYIGFFHTGAYQDSISGYGGIKHCLIPAPKLIVLDRDENGNIIDSLYREEQSVDEMLSILGY